MAPPSRPHACKSASRGVRRANPGVRALTASFIHFVDVDGTLSPEEQQVLERLLRYGPAAVGGAAAGRATVRARAAASLVVPRLGTISPWSSKATDIAHICGLAQVRRIERGILYVVARRGGRRRARRCGARTARSHDRVGARRALAEAAKLVRARGAAAAGAASRSAPTARAALEARQRALGLALAADEIDYLRRRLRRARARSHRRRADDVRAGQQRALPPQDLQRRLRRRRRAAADVAVPDDPAQHRGQPGGRAVGLQRQRRGDRGAPSPAASSPTRDAASTRRTPSRCTS